MLPAVGRKHGGHMVIKVRVADIAYVLEAADIQLEIEEALDAGGGPADLNKYNRLKHCIRRLRDALEVREGRGEDASL